MKPSLKINVFGENEVELEEKYISMKLSSDGLCQKQCAICMLFSKRIPYIVSF